MTSAAFSAIFRRLSIGVAHRGRHASGSISTVFLLRVVFVHSLPTAWPHGQLRALRERSRATPHSSSARLPCLPRSAVWRHGQLQALRERSRATPHSSSARLPCLPRSAVWRHGQLQALRERSRATPHSSSARLPCLPRSAVWRHGQLRASHERSTNAVFLVQAASTAGDARAVLPTLYSSSERLPRALRATRERFDQRCTPPPSGFAPRARRVSGSTFLNTLVDRRHPLDTIRSTEAARARKTSGNCECGTTAQAGGAPSSVSFQGDGARREPAALPVPAVRSDRWRSGTLRAAGRLHESGHHIGATRRRSAALHTSPGTPCVKV